MTDPIDAIVDVIATTAPEIREGLAGRRMYESGENPSGERQLAADLYADQLLTDRLLDLDAVAAYASEERDTIEHAPDDGGYHIAADPLDGSSNLKSNNTMGTLFGIYDAPLPSAGRDLVAAGYILYGPITTMVLARDGRVAESVLQDDGSREAVTRDLTLPDEATVYGFGGRVPKWPEAFASYVESVEQELKLRYSGAMIGDVNQVLTYGGIFGYPGLTDRPEGKLRLQFEGHPIAYIVEAAGGAASDGRQPLLDCEPAELHACTPVFVGDPSYVSRLEAALAG